MENNGYNASKLQHALALGHFLSDQSIIGFKRYTLRVASVHVGNCLTVMKICHPSALQEMVRATNCNTRQVLFSKPFNQVTQT